MNMLNKILTTFLAVMVSLSANAELTTDKMNRSQLVEITPISAKIREPFTALATVEMKIKNNFGTDLSITKITTDQARHVDIYEKYTNDIGAEQKKRVKDIFIKSNQTTTFSDNDKYQIMITGLTRKYEVNEEITLKFYFKDIDKNFTATFKVHPSYK
jgi:copper(I)-binding protein